MTQVQTMTNPELNRALADLMGWTVKNYLVSNDPVYGGWFVPMFDLVSPSGKSLMTTDNEEDSWSYAPDYCTDPATSLEVQTAAITKDKNFFLNNLTGVVAGYFPQSINWDIEWENDVIIMLISATPRERAEAAYITLHNSNLK